MIFEKDGLCCYRAFYGDHFGIAVAGYPEAHPDCIVPDPAEMDKAYWGDIHYLKQKVILSTFSSYRFCKFLNGMVS